MDSAVKLYSKLRRRYQPSRHTSSGRASSRPLSASLTLGGQSRKLARYPYNPIAPPRKVNAPPETRVITFDETVNPNAVLAVQVSASALMVFIPGIVQVSPFAANTIDVAPT